LECLGDDPLAEEQVHPAGAGLEKPLRVHPGGIGRTPPAVEFRSGP
jgi:hypothetical protein